MHIYHMVPEGLAGSVLYPLNELRYVHPRRYWQEMQKYRDRQRIRGQRIPTLNCLWNDVLFLSPVHPGEITSALWEAGFTPRPMSFFEIDPAQLDVSKTCVWLPEGDRGGVKRYQPFDSTDLPSAALSRETLRYYRRCKAARRKPLRYKFIPHILYKGELDISQASRIEA